VLKQIGAQAYRLALPEKYTWLHNIFPIQFIKEFKLREDNNQPPLLMPDLEDNDK